MDRCIICDAKSTKTTIWRCNEKGTAGIGACDKHRPLFEKRLQSTQDVLVRAHQIKREQPPKNAAH